MATLTRPPLPDTPFNEWAPKGACWGKALEDDPVDMTGRGKKAKALCAVCEVTDDCLAFGMHHIEHPGVYGGLSLAERRRKAGLPDSTSYAVLLQGYAAGTVRR